MSSLKVVNIKRLYCLVTKLLLGNAVVMQALLAES